MEDNTESLGRPNVVLPGAVVAVTGTSRGIGRALVGAFASAGARLIVHARRLEVARDVAAEAEAAGATGVATVGGDLRDPALPAALLAPAKAWGSLDLLVLNAGILGTMKSLESTSLASFQEVMQVNVDAQVPLVQGALPLMRETGRGMILWMSSGLGRIGLPGYGAYCASKHAIEGLMKIVAEEHAADGVVSVAVAPGMVQTDMLKAALLGADVSPYQSPVATAEAFVRLVTETDASINGQSLDIAPWLRA